ncbi:DUF397 domain-containing protein [Streptomyces sp. NPDC020875]|uniref:DUF397 domain-containing protein n=1 Tax=Streptomyces sp. NPDC020875 TaxID=3154898 RepID=UPI0033C6759D
MRHHVIDVTALTWRKSSHSNPDGGECVEVSDDLLTAATWFKSSHSNPDGGQCLEVTADFLATTAAWHKSSYSNPDGGACVEIAPAVPAPVVPVRDSKSPDGPFLIFPAADWSAFVTAIRTGSLPL